MSDEDKTKKEIINELKEMRRRVAVLRKAEVKHWSAEKVLEKVQGVLQERVKELNCLYGISKIVEKSDISLDETLQLIVELIPSAWQYPDIACARVILDGKHFETRNFKKTKWIQSVDLGINGNIAGRVEVGYLRKKPEKDEGPFLKEERNLLNVIGERLAKIIERKRAEAALKSSHRQLRSLSLHLQSVRERERTHIAREIHDELGQALTALKIDVSWLGKKLTENQQSLVAKTRLMAELIDTTIHTVQRISEELRPALLDDLGLSAAIRWQAKKFQEHSGINCEVSISPDEIILDRDRSTMIFRVFQETLTNIARHANATKVKIDLKENNDNLEMKVKDNGRGIERQQFFAPQSFGLIGIRERVRRWNGEFEIRGTPNRGTTVIVSIPLAGQGEGP